jgi:alpha-tubulin suppressor-like RCC1 family protein
MCHMGACTSSGKLYTWGCNKYGQLGCSDIKNHSLLPNEDMGSRNYIEVA